MYTDTTIQKLRMAQENTETSRGAKFRLFAAAKRHHAAHWDLLVSAPWLDDTMLAGLREIHKHLVTLDSGELSDFGSIIVLDKRSPVFKDIVEEFPTTETGGVVKNQAFGDIDYDRLNVLQVSNVA